MAQVVPPLPPRRSEKSQGSQGSQGTQESHYADPTFYSLVETHSNSNPNPYAYANPNPNPHSHYGTVDGTQLKKEIIKKIRELHSLTKPTDFKISYNYMKLLQAGKILTTQFEILKNDEKLKSHNPEILYSKPIHAPKEVTDTLSHFYDILKGISEYPSDKGDHDEASKKRIRTLKTAYLIASATILLGIFKYINIIIKNNIIILFNTVKDILDILLQTLQKDLTPDDLKKVPTGIVILWPSLIELRYLITEINNILSVLSVQAVLSVPSQHKGGSRKVKYFRLKYFQNESYV